MCRYARDLTPMFKVLAGSKKSEFLGLDTKMDLRKLKIFYMEDDSGSPLVSAVHKDLKVTIKKRKPVFFFTISICSRCY